MIYLYEEHDDSGNDVPLLDLIKTKTVKYRFTWEMNFAKIYMVPIFPERNITKYMDFSPREFLELFVDEEIIDYI